MNVIGYYSSPKKSCIDWVGEMYKNGEETQDNREILQTKIRRFLWVHNGCNAASVIASPLAGIIRIIMGMRLDKMVKNYAANLKGNAQVEMKAFVRQEIVRGFLELVGMGLVISIVEVLSVHVFKCGCVDAKKRELD